MPDFINVEEVLRNLELKETMHAAEFGCGSAAFAISLAKKLSRGRVFGLDIQQEKLSALKGRLAVEKLTNVATVLCDLEAPKGSTLKDGSLDIVLIPNVLFQSDNRRAILEEAARVLKPGGQLLIIDWIKEGVLGMKGHMMVSPEEIKTLAETLKLTLKKEFAVGDYHYGLLLTT